MMRGKLALQAVHLFLLSILQIRRKDDGQVIFFGRCGCRSMDEPHRALHQVQGLTRQRLLCRALDTACMHATDRRIAEM